MQMELLFMREQLDECINADRIQMSIKLVIHLLLYTNDSTKFLINMIQLNHLYMIQLSFTINNRQQIELINQRTNKLMQSDQQTIVSLIRLMKTDQVVMAQQKLMSMVENIEFMNKIFTVIRDNSLQPWVKTIASSFLNKAITQKLEEFGYKTMFTAISSILSSYDVVATDKRCFQSSIISLIEYIKEPQQIQEWRNFILQHINDERLFDTGLLLIDCTVIAEIQVDYLCMIVEDNFELTLKKAFVSLQSAMMVNELLKCWIVVFDKLTNIHDEEVVDLLLVKLATSRTLANLLFAVFEFNSPQEIWLCVNPQLYELNLLKYEAAELTKKVSEYAVSNKIPFEQCHALQITLQSYHKIKNTIAIVGASSNLEIMDMYQCEDFITSLFSLLVIYIKNIKEQSIQQMNILQHIVCYPFLKTREQEMYMFEDSPEEFNTLAEDLCDKQTFGILKTEAASLLQVISDNCKQAMSKSVTFCVECIKMSMGYIPKYESSEIKILDIETAFQLLAVYSFSLQHYHQQLESLKVILCDKRMMELPPLTLSKVFLFLAYNYEQVFKNPMDGSFWIDFALTYQAHPTTRYMALDFISNIADEYFTENFFNEITKLILEHRQRESGVVWNIVTKIFETQKEKINEIQCLSLVNTVFTRIEKEFEGLQQGTKESTQDIINALHILRKIVESGEYLTGKDTLKLRILDITVIFTKAIPLDLQDEIIKILTEYVKLNQEAAKERIFHLLPSILEQFKKDEYYQHSYFVFLNELIIKSKFTSIKPIIKSLLSGLMFHLFDMSENARKRKMKIAIANILTLLQNLLSIHGYQMSGTNDDCMCEIGAMAIRLFPSKEDERIFSKSLLAKALNLMFICHLYSKAENTVQYLIRFGRQNIFHKYDAYVLVKLLSKAVFAEDNIHIVIEYLNLMIEVTNEEEKNQKKGLGIKTAKGKLKIKRQEELSDLLYHITSPFIDFDYNKSKKQLPIKKEVVECISKMKSHNMETYKLIVLNMNDEQKNKLASIVNQTAQIQGRSRVIRKIIGIKPKQEQIAQKNENSDLQEDGEDESSNFKRKRVLLKKNESKRRNNENISVE